MIGIADDDDGKLSDGSCDVDADVDCVVVVVVVGCVYAICVGGVFTFGNIVVGC